MLPYANLNDWHKMTIATIKYKALLKQKIIIDAKQQAMFVKNAKKSYRSWQHIKYLELSHDVIIFNKIDCYKFGPVDTTNPNWKDEFNKLESAFLLPTNKRIEGRHLKSGLTLYNIVPNGGQAMYKQYPKLKRKIDPLYGLYQEFKSKHIQMDKKVFESIQKALIIYLRLFKWWITKGTVWDKPEPWIFDRSVYARDFE